MNKDANKGQAPTHLQRAGDGKKGEGERERERGGEERGKERDFERKTNKGASPNVYTERTRTGETNKDRSKQKTRKPERANERTRGHEREQSTGEKTQKKERERTRHPPGKKGRGRKKTTHQREGEGLRQKEPPAQKSNKADSPMQTPNNADRHDRHGPYRQSYMDQAGPAWTVP